MEEVKQTRLKNAKLKIVSAFENNKALLLKSLLFTFVLGLIAHGYMYFNNAISLDAMGEFIDDKEVTSHKIGIGRIFLPLYHTLVRGKMVLPYLTGLLSLLWIGLSVFLVCKIFDIKSNLFIFITACIFTLNLTVIVMTCAFLNDIDGNLLALFFSVLSAFVWRRYKYGYLFAVLPLTISLGLYQSYVSVTMVIMLMCFILDLLKGANFKETIISGLKACLTYLITAIIFVIALKVTCLIYGVGLSKGMYNSLDVLENVTITKLFYTAIWAYGYVIKRFISPVSLISNVVVVGLNGLLVLMTLVCLVRYIINKKIKAKELILAVILLLVIPIAVSFTTIISSVVREYMYYSICLFYLFILLLLRLSVQDFGTNKAQIFICCKKTSFIIVAFLMLSNIVLSNTAYTTKVFQKDANVSFMTRVVSDIEEVEGYKVGETEIVFFGLPKTQIVSNENFDDVKEVWGMQYDYFVYGSGYIKMFFNLYLMYPANIVDESVIKDETAVQEIKNMPSYPSEGSIKMIDGRVVVKFE